MPRDIEGTGVRGHPCRPRELLLAARLGRRQEWRFQRQGRHHEHIVVPQHGIVGGGQYPGQVLRLGIIAPMVVLLQIAPHEHGELGSCRQIVGSGATAPRKGVE